MWFKSGVEELGWSAQSPENLTEHLQDQLENQLGALDLTERVWTEQILVQHLL